MSLALASIGKRIKKTLKEGQVDAVIDELNEAVGQHMRAARSGEVMGYQRQPTIQQPPQIASPSTTATAATTASQFPTYATSTPPKDGHWLQSDDQQHISKSLGRPFHFVSLL